MNHTVAGSLILGMGVLVIFLTLGFMRIENRTRTLLLAFAIGMPVIAFLLILGFFTLFGA